MTVLVQECLFAALSATVPLSFLVRVRVVRPETVVAPMVRLLAVGVAAPAVNVMVEPSPPLILMLELIVFV